MDAAKKPVLLAVALFLCAVAPLAGQASADIFGVVQMKDGAMLPGVHVTASTSSPSFWEDLKRWFANGSRSGWRNPSA
jgi:hypothetical protein